VPVPVLIDKPGLIRFAIWLSGVLLVARGFSVALTLNPSWPKVTGVRANQSVICPTCSPQELTRRVRGVFRHSGECLFDFYRSLSRHGSAHAPVEFSPEFQRLMRRQMKGKPQFLVIPHTSNYDLIGGAATQAGMHLQVLTYARPPAAYRLDNQLRKQVGLEVTPVSVSALKRAMQNLRSGGSVLTAIDRPPDDKEIPLEERPLFFGRPANLPTGYLRLAQQSNAPLSVVAVQSTQPEGYRVWATDLIDPPAPGAEALRRSAEAILAVLEQFLRRFPEQWRMFYPVWPDEPESKGVI